MGGQRRTRDVRARPCHEHRRQFDENTPVLFHGDIRHRMLMLVILVLRVMPSSRHPRGGLGWWRREHVKVLPDLAVRVKQRRAPAEHLCEEQHRNQEPQEPRA